MYTKFPVPQNLGVMLGLAFSWFNFEPLWAQSGQETDQLEGSEHLRAGRTVSVGFKMGPRLVAGVGREGGFDVGLAGSFGFYLNKNRLVEFDYARTREPGIDEPSWGQLFLVNYKQYWSNSFFTDIGLGGRTLQGYGVIYESKFSFTKIGRFATRGTHAVLSAGVGNRWQWKNLSVGGDWFSYEWTLGEPRVRLDLPDGPPSHEKERAVMKYKESLKELRAEGPRLFIGVSL